MAYDLETKQILPFQVPAPVETRSFAPYVKSNCPQQVLSTRKRKDADESEIQVQVCLFGFDLLFLNDKSYVREPFRVRRETLHSHFKHTEGRTVFADWRL